MTLVRLSVRLTRHDLCTLLLVGHHIQATRRSFDLDCQTLTHRRRLRSAARKQALIPPPPIRGSKHEMSM
jgi:hypothetical protein